MIPREHSWMRQYVFSPRLSRYSGPRLKRFRHDLTLERVRSPPPTRNGAIRSARPEKLRRILRGETPSLFQDRVGVPEIISQ